MTKWQAKVAGSLVFGALLTLVLTACGGADPTATSAPTQAPPQATATSGPSAFELEWEALIQAAKAEGSVSTFGFDRDMQQGILSVFERQFGVGIVNSDGSGRQQAERTLAERQVGKYTLDIWIGGVGTPNRSLIPAGALQPIEPLLIHPEVLDGSGWFSGQHILLDPERQFIFGYAGDPAVNQITYNTNLVNPSNITSFWDLLKPEWKGKIVANDPRGSGATAHSVFFFAHPQLGPEFIRRTLTETDIVFAPDGRTAAEWLASGRYAICMWSCASEVRTAQRQGLPVSDFFEGTLAEGGDIRIGSGGLVAMDTPANPNAQKLFTNWFLSKEGQTLYQKVTMNNSMRVDIPKDDLPEYRRLVAGKDYLFLAVEPDYIDKETAALKYVADVLASMGR